MGSRRETKKAQLAEDAALEQLAKIRSTLQRELERKATNPAYFKGEPEHLCCTRKHNQMRISPLEARAIARAFRDDTELRRKLPEVLKRLRRELNRLEDNGERQSFDCPLLDGTRCLVHHLAKPVGCLAWHPQDLEEAAQGPSFTTKGWQAFAQRDGVNDRFLGPDWKLRVIPLWLKRVFSRKFERKPSLPSRRPSRGPGPARGRKRRRLSKKTGD